MICRSTISPHCLNPASVIVKLSCYFRAYQVNFHSGWGTLEPLIDQQLGTRIQQNVTMHYDPQSSKGQCITFAAGTPRRSDEIAALEKGLWTLGIATYGAFREYTGSQFEKV
ncbi:uncharacterized protein I303_103880 [Kwoniella dejecticola CBS 10117]|uniref:Uncharacterized protein n=1 Tax=Kwoniella dejecticola CBS 10117 TaxID=1296121 RepID=A0A1A6A7Z4_9TREE|nr:uncharacterized protein I303_03899 [Kwoniella dejecticola CBS 10117]OBR86179.1 hypothetical protein I303_03899 [Kwoniella dejecticola CBS 10117]